MNLFARLKAAFTNQRWMQSTATVVQGGDSKRPEFDHRIGVNSYRSWIYAAANLNAVAVASVPLRLYVRSSGSGSKLWNTRKASRRTKAFLAGDIAQTPSRYAMQKAAEYGDEYEVVTDTHPILQLLSKVNPYQNGYDATVLRVLYTELTGNAYLHPVIDRQLGIPVELWPMPPQYVEIIPGTERFIEGYKYGASRESRKTFAPDEVIHFKRPNPANLYYGIGKVEAAWGATMMNAAIHEMDLAFFENRGRPDWLLSIKSDASPEEIERLEVQIDSKLRGKDRNGRFLTATADIDVKPLSFPPKDLSGREAIVEEIAAVFGVPVSMLKANDPNLASAQTGFATWKETTILPMLRMDEETLNQNLIPLFGLEDDAFLAYDNPVIEDRRLALEERRTAVAGGWRTANEARLEEGRDAIDDPNADRLLINGQPLGGPQPSAIPFGASVEGSEVKSEVAQPAAHHVWGIDMKDALSDCVSEKIPDLISRGHPQDKAIAIAYSMCRSGKSAEEVISDLGIVGKDAMSDCVSAKISKLVGEGYPQDQAIAIAYSMCESGKSFEDVISEMERGESIIAKAISDIDTRPPQTVADNARRALEVRASKPESERGMTAVGLARARDLANRVRLSEDTIRRMVAYFERHQSDKEGETWDSQGKGWQAWNGWGGDDGWAWSKRKVEQFDREREKRAERSTVRKSCGCGCSDVGNDASPEAWLKHLESMDLEDCGGDAKNCGVGSGGFEEGNTCGSGGGGGSSPSPKPSGGRTPKGSAPAEGVSAPKEHAVKLPPNPRKIDIDTTENALRAMGYQMTAWKPSATGTTVTIRDSSGKETKLPSHEVVNMIYANSSDPKANAAPAIKPRKCADRDAISQKSLWWNYISTKATSRTAANEFAAITEDEDRIGAAVDKVLQRQIRETLKALRESSAPSQELTVKVQMLLRSSKWDREIVAAMRPYLQSALKDGLIVGRETVAKMATAIPDFNPPMPQLEAYVESESVRLARRAAGGVNRYTAVRVSKILGDGIEQGRTIDEIASDVQDWAGKAGDPERGTRSRALMIARTEAQRATRSAEVEAWKSSGIVEGKTWLLAPDPCEFCEAASAAFSQDGVGINDAFYSKGAVLTGSDGGEMSLDYEDIHGPPLHPNCRCSLQPKLVSDYADIHQEIQAEIEAEFAQQRAEAERMNAQEMARRSR